MVANLQRFIARIVIRHLALERLILGALGGSPRIAGCPIGSRDDLGIAEQEELIRGSRDCGVLIGSVDVVRELGDGLYLRLEVGRHEFPDLAGVHLLAELRLLPAAGIGGSRVHT